MADQAWWLREYDSDGNGAMCRTAEPAGMHMLCDADAANLKAYTTDPAQALAWVQRRQPYRFVDAETVRVAAGRLMKLLRDTVCETPEEGRIELIADESIAPELARRLTALQHALGL